MTSQDTQSPPYLLATHALGEPVGPWIARRRQQGATLKMIGEELKEKTYGKVNVYPKTLARWAAQ